MLRITGERVVRNLMLAKTRCWPCSLTW